MRARAKLSPPDREGTDEVDDDEEKEEDDLDEVDVVVVDILPEFVEADEDFVPVKWVAAAEVGAEGLSVKSATTQAKNDRVGGCAPRRQHIARKR